MSDASRLALIIGIDTYYDENLDTLPSCRKDAQDIVNLLSLIDYTIFGGSPIIGSDLDKKNGWTKIRENIGKFFIQARPSQTLLFYFSGHGILKGNELYLATPQIDSKDPATKGYSVAELTNYVSESRSRRIVCIIDACYSGAANLKIKNKAAKDDVNNARRLFDRSWKRIPKVKGSYLLLSSQSYEKSWAEDDNSIFTKYIIEGLRGVKPVADKNGRYVESSGSVDGNGEVTPDSLHDYVYEKVSRKTSQTPELKIARASKIILAEYPKLAKTQQISQKEHLFQLLQGGNIAKFNEMRKQYGYASLDFSGARLSNLNLNKVNLQGVILERADLSSCYLSGANLSEAQLNHAWLKSANLTYANLYHTNLYQSSFNLTILSYSNLSHANMSRANITHTKLLGCNLSDADLSFVDHQSYLDHLEPNFSHANLFSATLAYSNLHAVRFLDTNLSCANLSYADLSRADLAGSLLLNIKLYRELKCEQTDFEGVIIDNPNFANYLENNHAINTPKVVENRRELKQRLKAKGFSGIRIKKLINEIISNSTDGDVIYWDLPE